jgi:predicted transcriptional regulator
MAQTATETLHIRMAPELRTALERAARAEDRPVSWLARRIIADWLKRHDNRSN